MKSELFQRKTLQLKTWTLPNLCPHCRHITVFYTILHYFTLFYSPMCSILHLTELKTFHCPRGGLTFFLINFWLSLSGFTKQNFTGFLHSPSFLLSGLFSRKISKKSKTSFNLFQFWKIEIFLAWKGLNMKFLKRVCGLNFGQDFFVGG